MAVFGAQERLLQIFTPLSKHRSLTPKDEHGLLTESNASTGVLESLEIMDYSLLLGVHNLDQAKRERQMEKQATKQINNAKTSTPSGGDDIGAPSAKRLPDDSNPNGLQHDTSGLQHHKTSPLRSSGSQHGTASDSFRWARAPPGADGEKIVTIGSDLPTGGPSPSSTFERDAARARSTKRLAAYCTAMESIEASAKPVELEKEEMDLIPSGGIPARNSNGDRLLLFLGIIDILQSYRLIKKLEHGFKAIAIDGRTVSVTPPGFYSQRFQESLSRHVFKRIQSLDQPTLLGPNAMRFRRFVEMAMKQASSKRTAPPGRLPTIRSSDEEEEEGHSRLPSVTRPAVLSSSTSRNGSTQSVFYPSSATASNSLLFPNPLVWNRPASAEIDFPPAPQLRSGHDWADTVSHPSPEFNDSTGGTMGPNRHGQQEYRELSTARRHCSSCELNLRSGKVQYPSLPPNTDRGSTRGRNSSNRLTEYQRNARSHTQLNQCSLTRVQHSGRIPTRVLNELIPDLDRSASHLSVASILTTSSESDGSDRQHVSRSSVHSHSGEPTLITGRSIVTPEHPRVVYISGPNSKVNVDVTPQKPPIPCTNHRIHTTGAPNQELLQVVNGVPKTESHSRNAKRTETVRRNPARMVFDSLPTSLIKRRLPVDRSLGVQGNELPAIPASKSYSGLTSADSLEYFMQDAVLRFRETAYDPYGLARKNLLNQLNTTRAVSATCVNRNSADSMSSSGRCSLMSAQSASRVQALDRRRRRRREIQTNSSGAA
ncbi:hypothetical protein CRM22_009618 [Opisthorchis felineus]|uniref:PIPK domain-containing protein n=1 Tax=Opisthorchis felineus TaxID=147828 RepID=A0A4S2LDW5_OPIFE|nr:hypothetical protein CRM22_009618 [Opisthorchis felineus]